MKLHLNEEDIRLAIKVYIKTVLQLDTSVPDIFLQIDYDNGNKIVADVSVGDDDYET